MRRLLSLVAVAVLTAACGMSSGAEVSDTSGSALARAPLTATECEKPIVTTKPLAAAGGGAIPGSASTSISGCLVGGAGESGHEVIGRVVALLGDTAGIGKVKTASGEAVFAKFVPGATRGALSTGLVQEVDVTLEMFGSPSSRLRITRQLSADGIYSLHITNITPFKASVAFVPVTAIEPGGLTLAVQMKPEENGLSVTGRGAVTLEVMQDEASEASELVRDLFSWLTTELAR